MRATVHVLDGGSIAGLRLVTRPPLGGGTAGLREAIAMTAAPLTDSTLARPQLGRVGLVAFWDDDQAIDRFERDHESTWTTACRWTSRLEPVRAVPVAGGHFPGVPTDLPTSTTPRDHDPVAVITIGRLRKRLAVPFFRTNAQAQAQITSAKGHLWSTGFANIVRGVVSTFSLWESGAAAHAFATTTAGHRTALGRESERSFHHVGSFVRFRPYAARGELSDGANPLSASVTALLTG